MTVKSTLAREILDHPVYSTGSLVEDGGTIYLIYQTKKIPFTNFKAFEGLGYSLDKVVKGNVSALQTVASYQIDSNDEEHPWGSWLLDDGTIYYSDESGVIAVPTWDIFLNNGGTEDLILPANKFDLEILKSFEQQPLMSLNDARIYRD